MHQALPIILYLVVSIVGGPNKGDAQVCSGFGPKEVCGKSVTVQPAPVPSSIHFKAGKVSGKYKYTLIYVDGTKSRATAVEYFYVHKDGTISDKK